ncbi:hypothetical protein CROQUDRAFT_652195 [Cronartium quercuum f. sp. fusiforme G11]|uniref:Phosphoglucomutase n=1 Tax=Cronartium quercuum f. sp. fusiforme G11 TaxID=708437 RepID=A0A9P6TG38_9BASI|nr:hypothetical protein CROQUDRAFT_652195 [Cronartium quercuum f. sp. fusiforme G11]
MTSGRSLEWLKQEWLRLDRNLTTRAQIEELWAKGNTQELKERLSKRISFGTAGLRAEMCAGFARMNDLTVIQATQGLAAYLLQNIPDVKTRGVVIGHDHRHNSQRFAHLTAVAFIRREIKCYLLRGIIATPIVPFGTKFLGAAAGVMVTASHNPASDNGYKLYYSNAVQIIPPHDTGIAAAIEQNLEVDAEAWDIDLVTRSEDTLCIDRTEEIKEEYLKLVATLTKRSRNLNANTPVTFIYTPMHGVGLPFVTKAFTEAYGFPQHSLIPVPQQSQPDPDFPSVKFPNPEEKGALDLAMRLGEEIYSQDSTKKIVLLANDPDADRFCAGEWLGSKWHVFSGDEIGSILGVWSFEQYKRSGQPLSKLAMLASTPSSKLLAAVAAKEGFKFKETLTGFKYLGNAALELEKESYTVPFAYEEALGYMCGTQLRDKDGITALSLWAELTSELAEKGTSLVEYLESIYQRYGYFATNNGYFACKDASKVDQAFHRLRFGETQASVDLKQRESVLQVIQFPKTLASYPIESIRDLTIGYDNSRPPKFMPDLPTSAGSQMVTFTIGGEGGQVIATLRTSGTETWKLKYYVEGSAPHQNMALEKVNQVVAALRDEWGLGQL